MIWNDDEQRRKDMDAEFRAQKGLPTDYDEAVQIAAEKEVERRTEAVKEDQFSKDVLAAANKMEGPSAKEAGREKPWIPMPDSLREPEDFSD